jgi:hypothetical protein
MARLLICLLVVFLGSSCCSLTLALVAPSRPLHPSSTSSQTSTRLFENESKGGIGGIGGGFFKAVGDAFAELDAFVDDASARRLGNGAAFYGKRKSNFYGNSDKNKKVDPSIPDPLEDYQGPTSTGLFMWQQDENGQMRPVTRMKNKIIERNPNFWDRVYDKNQEES